MNHAATPSQPGSTILLSCVFQRFFDMLLFVLFIVVHRLVGGMYHFFYAFIHNDRIGFDDMTPAADADGYRVWLLHRFGYAAYHRTETATDFVR